jgi:hypothetical protein
VVSVTRPKSSVPARLALALAALALLSACQLLAPGGASARSVSFHGHQVQVPSSWPVYRLAQHPGMCVRLDRRAVYLGAPAANQHCPADAIGRRRAILIDPGAAARAGASSAAAPAPVNPRAGASASATVFTGLGFDACSAPSAKAMSAWASSPYRAIGVYIGGTNRACSQPNLTPGWVDAETEAGWHLIPTYVGLQAPTSDCGSCAKLSSSQATAQGIAAAVDAVAEASAVAMGPGSPIYFDMEAYNPSTSSTAATLTFLEAWTKKLHSLGYLSGVYSSTASGIADLGREYGSGYVLPDYLWFANWNGAKSTTDPVIPAGAWTPHRRIHQYQGGHDERYGGVTINIDNNYVDGGTVAGASSAGGDDPIGSLELTGAAHPGEVRVRGWAFDPDFPTETLGIRVFVGGRAGAEGALEYELGQVANLARPAVASRYATAAGKNHGFDVTFPTLKSGPQPVCVYAVDIEPGADRLLGCKSTPIQVAITLSHVRASADGVHVRIACEWPAGTECPGQLTLRAQIKVAQRLRGRPPRLRSVIRGIAHRTFHLTGKHSHAYVIPLSAGGRQLLRERGRLKTQLVAAIPGGRRVAMLGLRQRAG